MILRIRTAFHAVFTSPALISRAKSLSCPQSTLRVTCPVLFLQSTISSQCVCFLDCAYALSDLAKAQTAERRKEGRIIFGLPDLFELLLRNYGCFTTCFQPRKTIYDCGLLRSFSEYPPISSLIRTKFDIENSGTHLLLQSK